MKQIKKILNWILRSIVGGIILIVIITVIAAAFMGYQGWQESRQVNDAAALVKEKINYQPTDVFSGCVHPNNGVTIVSVNREIFFGVKDSRVFIPQFSKWHEQKAKDLAPNLPVEQHQINVYYLLENCK